MLKAVPENPVLTPVDVANDKIEYATIRMDHVNGTHVYGQLAKPEGERQTSALVIFQWASPPYPLQKDWVTGHAAKGWLTLNIEPHDVLPDRPQVLLRRVAGAIKTLSIDRQRRSRQELFPPDVPADYRAVDYITHASGLGRQDAGRHGHEHGRTAEPVRRGAASEDHARDRERAGRMRHERAAARATERGIRISHRTIRR